MTMSRFHTEKDERGLGKGTGNKAKWMVTVIQTSEYSPDEEQEVKDLDSKVWDVSMGKEFKKKKDLFFDPLVAEIWPQASSKCFHGVSSATRPDHVKSMALKAFTGKARL